jgi:hypothetical protein
VVEIATLTEQVKTLDKEHTLHQTIAGITGSVPEMLSGDIQTVREGFKKLSRALTGYVKTADPKGSRNRGLKIFYCPMVKEEWIQKGDAVENPYYGQSMLQCGRVRCRCGVRHCTPHSSNSLRLASVAFAAESRWITSVDPPHLDPLPQGRGKCVERPGSPRGVGGGERINRCWKES